MGNYSYINEQIYTMDVNKFMKKVAPYYSEVLERIPEQYRQLNKLDTALASMSDSKCGFLPELSIVHDELHLDMDGWKIQGYWYDDYCKMLELFHSLGLRGHIDMTEETEQDFVITFTDKQVEVEIWGPADQDLDEEDEWVITTPSRDQESTKGIIKGGNLI